jgi:hypothetical protein
MFFGPKLIKQLFGLLETAERRWKVAWREA